MKKKNLVSRSIDTIFFSSSESRSFLTLWPTLPFVWFVFSCPELRGEGRTRTPKCNRLPRHRRHHSDALPNAVTHTPPPLPLGGHSAATRRPHGQNKTDSSGEPGRSEARSVVIELKYWPPRLCTHTHARAPQRSAKPLSNRST